MDPVTNYCESVLGDNKTAKSALRQIPEFSDCSEDLLDMVFKYSKPVNLKPGEILIQEGLFDQWVYFIINGELDVIIADKNLGATSGPIVGERCILGEPRGADLVAGKEGLLALGVEMTIIDQLNRDVNDFQKTTENESEVLLFSEAKMSVGLELLVIILKEVVGRIINIHRTSKITFDVLKRSRPALNIQLQSIYSFSDNGTKDTSKLEKEIKTDPVQNISVYNFNDFADIVYFELLQKKVSEIDYKSFSQAGWKNVFKVDENHNATITQAYNWLKKDFGLLYQDLIGVTYSIFEVASKYLAAASNSISDILSISDCEEEKQKIMDAASIDERIVDESSQVTLLEKLFTPIEQKLKTNKSTGAKAEPGKMSQSDIDALFE